MSDDLKQPEPTKRFRWGKLVLVLSLGLNLMVLGIVGGAVLGHDKPDRRSPPRVDILSFGPYTAALSDEHREVLKKDLFGERNVLRETRKGLRDDIKGFVALLRVSPYDPVQAQVLIRAPSVRIASHVEMVQGELLALIATMDDAERAAYADRLEQEFKRGPGKPPRDGDKPK